MASNRNPGLTRRQWASIAVATPLLVNAQTPLSPEAPPSGPQPLTTTGSIQKANESVRRASEQLSQIELSPDIEPAFAFKAIP